MGFTIACEQHSGSRTGSQGTSHSAVAPSVSYRASCHDEVEVLLLDDNILSVTSTDIQLLPISAGPQCRAWLSSLGAYSLRWLPHVVNLDGPDHFRLGLDAVAADQVDRLQTLLLDRDSGWYAQSFHQSTPYGLKGFTYPDLIAERLSSPSRVCFTGHQPGYHRYLGFFAKMAAADVFTYADDMQFARQDWQHRQRFPSADNTARHWLTVPLRSAESFQSIAMKQIVTEAGASSWQRSHWQTIKHAYQRTPYWDRYAPFLESVYTRPWTTLNALNEAITRYVAHSLGIAPAVILRASQMPIPEGLRKGERIAAEIPLLFQRAAHPTPAVAYLAGSDTQYLDSCRPDGRRERDFLTSVGACIHTCALDQELVTRLSGGLDPRAPAIEFLFQLGPGASELLKLATRIQDCEAGCHIRPTA